MTLKSVGDCPEDTTLHIKFQSERGAGAHAPPAPPPPHVRTCTCQWYCKHIHTHTHPYTHAQSVHYNTIDLVVATQGQYNTDTSIHGMLIAVVAAVALDNIQVC